MRLAIPFQMFYKLDNTRESSDVMRQLRDISFLIAQSVGYGTGSFERKTKANTTITKYYNRHLAPRKNVDCDSDWGCYNSEIGTYYRWKSATQ